eukprot:TRINITY_DN23325_c0_g1_i2.p1 TRINITY_DN23325_c0_g1~~TRINITY_DN23325_c0_g1_i2.p1  ORF type:complete len:456 (+),score=57.12 TRINITY_DN23325_c0_g1_i2:3-1370(+)
MVGAPRVNCMLSCLFLIAFSSSAVYAKGVDFQSVRTQAAGIHEEIVSWRRELHKHPELMYQEHHTSRYIQEVLSHIGVSFTTGWSVNTRQDRIPGPGGTGVVAEIGSGKPPIVALRADIDALPITEETPIPFKSENPGRMHACGHDGHASMLLGAAKLLSGHKKNLPGTVRLIFQPAEEGGAGAKRMLEEGVLKNVSRIFGLHVWPGLPTGSIGGRAGVTMAAGDFFEFRIIGKGAHGAMPHQGMDPITAAAAIVQSLQTLVARETDPLDAAVVSVTKLNSGDAFNVIPEVASIGGTIRALSVEGLEFLRKRLVEVAGHVALAHRCRIEDVKFMPDYFPPTKNDKELWQWVESPEVGIKQSATELSMHWSMSPTMGGEDFSFYAQDVPGAFIFLGQGSGPGIVDAPQNMSFPTSTPVHSPRFNMDETVLDLGAALHTHLAMRSLEVLRDQRRSEL